MFFEKEMLSFKILNVMELNQKNVYCSHQTERDFNALSFRYSADAILKTETEEHHVKDGTVAYVPARLKYSRIATKDSLIVVHFDTTAYPMQAIECFEAKDPDKMLGLFRKMLECWSKKEVGYRYRCSAILYEILAECYAQNYKPAIGNSKIQRSVDYILNNYKNSDLSIKEVADRSFMSEVYFRKLFKAEYGISPQKYIINLRIQNAAELICMGYYSLSEVAEMSGYNDYKYFSVEFKKVLGASPSEYLYNCEHKALITVN